MAGAVAIDASNDLSGGPGGAMHHLDAWAERAPGVPVARAFCSLGWENIAEPSYDGVAAERVETVIRDVGFDPVRIGGADAAGVLDGVARLWFQLAFSEGLGRALGFRLLRRDG
jgi:predicted dinucleotide-binding enzyme